ncbi:MAG: cell division protein FtsZ [Bacteroidetes bacterium]|nr:cell division protein FtsZ [Bacteroidota bacterium]
MNFEMTNKEPSIIKVIGVGGGGSNAVNHMCRQGIRGVDFIVCNTDLQALEISPVPIKVQLGPTLTEGRGAGSIPNKGREAALENVEDVRKILSDGTKMVFITAGMGGGTGTGAAPVIAGIAKSMGILTVGIVTIPFVFEGRRRKDQATNGLDELKRNVDTLLVISNDRLRQIHGDLKLTNAFGKADDILTIAAKNIAEIITVSGYINVDFADVETVLRDSGVAIMGRGMASGADRARLAVELAMDSPLLNDREITDAKHILLNITSGNEEISMDEVGEITDFIQEKAGEDTHLILGTGYDEELGDNVCITLIATGFKTSDEIISAKNAPKREVINMVDAPAAAISQTVITNNNNIEPVMISQLQTNVLPVNKVESPAHEVFNLNDEIKPEAIFNAVAETNMIVTDMEGTLVNGQSMQEELVKVETEVQNEPSFQEEVIELPVEPEEESNSFVFNLVPPAEEIKQEEIVIEEAPKLEFLLPENKQETEEAPKDDAMEATRQRIMRLRELTYKLQNNSTNDNKDIPAYIRKNTVMQNTPQSNESNVGRHTVGPDANGNNGVRENNAFFHDKVD